MSNIVTQAHTAFRSEGHVVSGSDASGTLPISAHSTRWTATGSNEVSLNLQQVNRAFNGIELIPVLRVSGSIQFNITAAGGSGSLTFGMGDPSTRIGSQHSGSMYLRLDGFAPNHWAYISTGSGWGRISLI